MKKLTLSAEEDVIKMAHQIAEQRGISISSLFSRFIRSLAQGTPKTKIGSVTKRATGLIQMPESISERELLTDELLTKHGINR